MKTSTHIWQLRHAHITKENRSNKTSSCRIKHTPKLETGFFYLIFNHCSQSTRAQISCLFHQDAPGRIARNSRLTTASDWFCLLLSGTEGWCLCMCTWADASAPDALACTEMKRLGARRGDAAESIINESGRSEDSLYWSENTEFCERIYSIAKWPR